MPRSSRPRSAAQRAPVRQSVALARSGAGALELLRDDGGRIRIRILDGTGAVLALSPSFPDTAAALKGVEALREYAATSHVSDQTAPHPEATRPRPGGRSVNGPLSRGGAGSLPGLSGALHPRLVAGSPAPLPTQGVSVEVA
jgi:hypothetical protein